MENLEREIMYVWIATSFIIGVFASLFLGGVTGFLVPDYILFVTPLLVFLPFLLAVYSVFRYRNWGFEVREDHLYVEHGVLRKVSMVIPYVRVQHIDTNRGPLERVLGLASLRVYTAGSKGADIRVPGLLRGRSEEIQEDLKKKAIESEKGFDAV